MLHLFSPSPFLFLYILHKCNNMIYKCLITCILKKTSKKKRKKNFTEYCGQFSMLIHLYSVQFSSVQFRSVAQSCPTLCDPMNRSTPGLLVHHQLPGVHSVHRVGDAIQPSSVVPFSSYPQSLPASESFPMSQLFA